jgi:hypothetical protein
MHIGFLEYLLDYLNGSESAANESGRRGICDGMIRCHEIHGGESTRFCRKDDCFVKRSMSVD